MKYILVLILSLFLVGCGGQKADRKISRTNDCRAGLELISLESADRETTNFCVEIADDTMEITQGLMYRQEMPADEGMLFVFADEDYRSFWMKNTLIELDLLFFDAVGRSVDFKDNFEPCRELLICPSYQSVGKAKYVLELNSDALPGGEYQLFTGR